MNLLLVDQTEVSERGLVTVTGRRAEHLVRTLHVEAGSVVMAGVVDGGIGRAEVLSVTPAGVTFRLDLGAPPPRPTTIVILAMVRPQIMKRTLQHLATLGVRHIALIGARRVEKSYFSQRLFDGDGYREHLLLGLEQARDTWLPTLSIHRRFRPFIEDVAPTLLALAGMPVDTRMTGRAAVPGARRLRTRVEPAAAPVASPELEADVLERLRSLGYVQ